MGASIFNPAVAKHLSRNQAMTKLEKLRHLPALNLEGEDKLLTSSSIDGVLIARK